MAKQVNIHAAKTNFSKLVEEVEAGAEIVIARAGKPVMRLVKYDDEELAVPRQFGFAKDLLEGVDLTGFDDYDEDFWAGWNAKTFDPKSVKK